MNQPIRFLLAFFWTVVCLIVSYSPNIHANEIFPHGEGERVLRPGIVKESFLLSTVVKKYLSTCIDLGGSIIAVSDRQIWREPVLSPEIQHGTWFYCFYDDRADYIYHSAGTNFYSQLGWPESKLKSERTYEVLPPGEGEIIISPGFMEGDFLLSAAVRKALSTCYDIGGSIVALPVRGAKSELFFTSEIRYGLWYCCLPNYYIDYLYLSFGAGSFSQMGSGERENAFTLSYGSGLRINLLGNYILGVELRAYSIFREKGRSDRIAFLVGGGLSL